MPPPAAPVAPAVCAPVQGRAAAPPTPSRSPAGRRADPRRPADRSTGDPSNGGAAIAYATPATITPAPAGNFPGLRRQHVAALLVVVVAVALAVTMARQDGTLAALWALGIAAGFTLQRSRFCFASAFRDLYLFGSARTLKGVIVGLGVATTGFAAIMHAAVPLPGLGLLPPEAHVLPVGISTAIGGVLFGYGMVLSGGCVSGSLYRSAEGYVASWVTLAGVLVGLGAISQTWNWWWETLIRAEPKLWLPSTLGLGYAGAIALTFAALVATYLFALWWEARADMFGAVAATAVVPAVTFRARLAALWHAIFVKGWPAVIGGAALGGISIVMYTVHMPWGVTGELLRWSNAAMAAVGAPPPEALGLADIGGCAGRADETGLFSHTFSVTVGLVPGALIGALLSTEFKLRFPRRAIRYAQSAAGGVVMGLGAGLGLGCTIGSFFSSVASLSLSGWLFGAALAVGAYAGTQTIRRIP